jgi:hypothetical protein
LQALQLIHGAIKLTVQVGFIPEQFVGGAWGRQAEASSLGVHRQLLTLDHVCFEDAQSFQPILDQGEDIGV